MKRVAFLGLVVCLLVLGCDDSKTPLTDTKENVARFVAEAGDKLLNTKEPVRFERVVDRQHGLGLLFPEKVE